MNVFDILMVIAVGSLIGTGIGLIIGSVAEKQKYPGPMMTKSDITCHITLVVICSCISIAGLAWQFLV
jgi:hypothetical protein